MKFPLSYLVALPLFFSLLITTGSGSTSRFDSEGPAVNGSFEIALENGSKRHIEFHASRGLDGAISGETVFRDTETSTKAAPTDNSPKDSTKPLFLKAPIDCLTIKGNKAVMSGAVTEASWEQYIGRRVLIVAQENGGPSDSAKRDKLTWGVYRNTRIDWLASDSERPGEESRGSWLATDAERPEDDGVPSNNEMTIGCQTFPLSSFTFITAKQGQGTVKVRE